MGQKLKVAVVGGGVAGITAAHLLSRRHEVTLFEASPRLGGHANSVTIQNGVDDPFEVDTAFLVFNDGSYPRFLKLLAELGVADRIQNTDMSMSFFNRDTGLQYALNAGTNALLADRRNALRPQFWKLLREIKKFREEATAYLSQGTEGQSLKEFAARNAHSRQFAENFLYPMGASVWSLPGETMADFPAELYFRFFSHHKTLKREQGAQWKTMKGGSIQYLRAFERRFNGTILRSAPIRRIRRNAEGITLRGESVELGRFDRLILGTHADQSLAMLENPTPEETAALAPWKYLANPTILHTDASVMPTHTRAWSSWNIGFQRDMSTKSMSHGVTYHLNRIQNPKTRTQYFVSLGQQAVAEDKILQKFSYRHPVYDRASLATQPWLAGLGDQTHTYFCGSYLGNGFHEAAIQSAANVAEKLEVEWSL